MTSHLLVGCGKTDDCRADTIYADVSRFSNERIGTVKEKLKEFVDRANWHRPSVLILDGLDALCAAEIEVRVSQSGIRLCVS